MSISLLSSVSKGWLYEEGGLSFGQPYYMQPLYRQDQDIKIDQFLRERFPEYAFYNMESNLAQPDFWRADFVYVGGIQPNLILGVCLGAQMAWYEDKDIDFVEANPLGDVASIEELPDPTDVLAHPFVQHFERQILELQETRPELTIIPPFFWDLSGRATIHGFITSSMKFYGERIFIKAFEDPDFVWGLHEWIADVSIVLMRHFSALANIPITSVHIGECAGTMISGRHYEQFVVPYLNKIAEAVGPIRLHSCGHSDHLLTAIAKINKLQVLDTGSNTSIAAVRDQLGHDLQIDLAPPLEVLRQGAGEEMMLEWLDRTLLENNDGPLKLGYHLEPGYSMQNCLALHDELDRRGLIRKGRP